MAVLLALACSATLGDRMGAAGTVSDLWGPPRPRLVARWEQAGKSWMVAATGGSEAREQGVAGNPRGRAPPATKAPVRAVSGDSSRLPLPVSATALLRYSVVAEVEALVLRGWPAGAAVRHADGADGADRVDLDGRLVRISVRTLQRWRAAWASGKLAGLEPRQRTRTTTSQALSPKLVAFLHTEKQRDARASAPELVRRARARGIVPADAKIDRTTVWRACRRMGLPTRQRPHKHEGDTRRWRYAERLQCVLADGKHFRAGAARLRRVALFFLDDATRYGLEVLVGTAESSELFLRALYQMVMRHGLADLFFLDKGPGFNSHDTQAVVQGGLGALLIHGATRYPEGHGAIERFHRTAYDQVLRSLDDAADVDPACAALTLRLRHFLERYNDTPHETLGKDITPRQRWERGRDLRFPTDDADRYRRFVVRAMHQVSNDHVIKAGGRLWEAPRRSAASWVEVARHVLDGRLCVQHQGRMIELAEVDPHANATEPRGSGSAPQPTAGKDGEELPATAAGIAYANDLRPLVDPEGGYSDPQDDQHDDQQEQHP